MFWFAYPGDNDRADARQLGAGAKPGDGCVQRPQPDAKPGILAGAVGGSKSERLVSDAAKLTRMTHSTGINSISSDIRVD